MVVDLATVGVVAVAVAVLLLLFLSEEKKRLTIEETPHRPSLLWSHPLKA